MSCSLLSLHSGYKTPCSHSLLQCSGNVSYYYYSVHQFPLRFVQLSLNFSSNGVTSVFVTEPSSVINFINLLFHCKCKSAPTAWPPFIGSVKALRSSVNVEPWCRPCLRAHLAEPGLNDESFTVAVSVKVGLNWNKVQRDGPFNAWLDGHKCHASVCVCVRERLCVDSVLTAPPSD